MLALEKILPRRSSASPVGDPGPSDQTVHESSSLSFNEAASRLHELLKHKKDALPEVEHAEDSSIRSSRAEISVMDIIRRKRSSIMGGGPNLSEGVRQLGLVGFLEGVAAGERSIEEKYEAWKDVEDYTAPSVIGEVRAPNGELLSNNGFIGYFVHENPEKIVKILITEIGERIFESIHNQYGKHDVASDPTESEVKAALHDPENIPPMHRINILIFFDSVLNENIGRVSSRKQYADFQDNTYRRIKHTPGDRPAVIALPHVAILENEHEVEAWNALRDIGQCGKPEIRTEIERARKAIA
jgi:hypothetical protein